MTEVMLDFVISANGMIARTNGDEDWLPEGGWHEFLGQVQKYKNVIIGRETYDQVTEKYEHDNFDEIHGVLKIIVSKNKGYITPKAGYSVVHSPEEAITLVESQGLDYAYIGGGGELAASFLRSKLVSRLRLAIIPKVIANGRSFTGSSDFADVEMELLSQSVRDDIIILEYKVLR